MPDGAALSTVEKQLNERVARLTELRDLFSAQAKVAEAERQSVKKIGIALQALCSLSTFRDDASIEVQEEEKKIDVFS